MKLYWPLFLSAVFFLPFDAAADDSLLCLKEAARLEKRERIQTKSAQRDCFGGKRPFFKKISVRRFLALDGNGRRKRQVLQFKTGSFERCQGIAKTGRGKY